MSKKNKIYGLCRKIIIGMEVGTKVIVILLFTIVFAIKIYKIDFSIIQADIITILSFLVSFFAIGLSVIFYFKADETNNRFYHQTYIFIKETSTLLGRIEATFGTKLDGIKSDFDKYWNGRDYSKEKEEEKKAEEKLKNDLESSKNRISELLAKIKANEKDKNELINEIEKTKKINGELIKNQVETKDRIRMPVSIRRQFIEYIFQRLGRREIMEIVDENKVNILEELFMDYVSEKTEAREFFFGYLRIENKKGLKEIFSANYDLIKRRIYNEF